MTNPSTVTGKKHKDPDLPPTNQKPLIIKDVEDTSGSSEIKRLDSVVSYKGKGKAPVETAQNMKKPRSKSSAAAGRVVVSKRSKMEEDEVEVEDLLIPKSELDKDPEEEIEFVGKIEIVQKGSSNSACPVIGVQVPDDHQPRHGTLILSGKYEFGMLVAGDSLVMMDDGKIDPGEEQKVFQLGGEDDPPRPGYILYAASGTEFLCVRVRSFISEKIEKHHENHRVLRVEKAAAYARRIINMILNPEVYELIKPNKNYKLSNMNIGVTLASYEVPKEVEENLKKKKPMLKKGEPLIIKGVEDTSRSSEIKRLDAVVSYKGKGKAPIETAEKKKKKKKKLDSVVSSYSGKGVEDTSESTAAVGRVVGSKRKRKMKDEGEVKDVGKPKNELNDNDPEEEIEDELDKDLEEKVDKHLKFDPQEIKRLDSVVSYKGKGKAPMETAEKKKKKKKKLDSVVSSYSGKGVEDTSESTAAVGRVVGSKRKRKMKDEGEDKDLGKPKNELNDNDPEEESEDELDKDLEEKVDKHLKFDPRLYFRSTNFTTNRQAGLYFVDKKKIKKISTYKVDGYNDGLAEGYLARHHNPDDDEETAVMRMEEAMFEGCQSGHSGKTITIDCIDVNNNITNVCTKHIDQVGHETAERDKRGKQAWLANW